MLDLPPNHQRHVGPPTIHRLPSPSNFAVPGARCPRLARRAARGNTSVPVWLPACPGPRRRPPRSRCIPPCVLPLSGMQGFPRGARRCRRLRCLLKLILCSAVVMVGGSAWLDCPHHPWAAADGRVLDRTSAELRLRGSGRLVGSVGAGGKRGCADRGMCGSAASGHSICSSPQLPPSARVGFRSLVCDEPRVGPCRPNGLAGASPGGWSLSPESL
jgi:hypothetical protein